jgi:hypothetical protein
MTTFIVEDAGMASYQVLYWQEIPSQVDARDAGKAHKEKLSQRFQELIDVVATKRNIVQSDAYINGWSKGEKSERPGTALEVAKGVASELEAQYESIRAAALAKSNA